MAGLLTLDLKGFDEVMNNLDRMDDSIKKEISGTLERGAQTFVRNAMRDAPIRKTPITKSGGTFGSNLKQGISYFKEDPLSFMVVSAAEYSAYMEFGTIKYVFYGEPWLTDEDIQYAEQFKGNGIRKTGGIYPHPFFFKQQGPVKEQIETGIEAILKDLKL